MGVATTMAVAGGVGLLGSSFQTIKGISDSNRARRELENYQRQELTSPFEGMQVSTMGADLQREEANRMAMAQTEALQGAGVRGVVGGLGRVDAQNQILNAQIGAGLDEQRRNIDMALAQDRAGIRGMQEQREYQDIAALSSQYNAGQQMMMAGLGGLGQTAISMAPYMDGVFAGSGQGGVSASNQDSIQRARLANAQGRVNQQLMDNSPRQFLLNQLANQTQIGL